MDPPEATRHVTLRDGRREGEPDVEPGAGEAQPMKEAMRDLTSLSGPPLRQKPKRDESGGEDAAR